MVVTLEVLKLSGWLNADAYCRESRKQGIRCGKWCGPGSGIGRWVEAAQASSVHTRGGAHREHLVHVLDARGVEAQRLVERRRLLPSRKESTHTVRGELRPGRRREAAGNGGARSVHRGGLDCGLGAGHGEGRTRNMRSMFVTLEVSKLSGWLNATAP
eukprot:scaffold92250_cov61-Phaeocystis_antarctica.AAC.8